MLGMEKDIFLIDTKTGKTYNIGEEAVDDVDKQIQSICGLKSAKYRANRFVIIRGTECGIYTLNSKTRRTKFIHNPNMIKKGKQFASNY